MNKALYEEWVKWCEALLWQRKSHVHSFHWI